MSILAILAIGVGLSMDAFAVSVAAGISLKRHALRTTFRLAFHFGLFQALMPVIGWSAGSFFAEYVQAWDHWLAFGLLLVIGARMCMEGLRPDSSRREAGDPSKGLSLVMLSVGTSIDALAVGFSLAFLGVPVATPALIIGITTLAISAVGYHLGVFIGQRLPLGRAANILGGMTLIAIGIKILFEHGVL
jgi:manganese efflux pump family protein